MEKENVQLTVKLELEDYQKFSAIFQDRIGFMNLIISVMGIIIIDYLIRLILGITIRSILIIIQFHI